MTDHVHRLAPPVVDQKLPLQEIIWYCFLHMYHLDRANAPIHTNVVRYSPLTFRIAEYLWNHFPSYQVIQELRSVVLDSGQYDEDPGR
jgi:hypothetical protein